MLPFEPAPLSVEIGGGLWTGCFWASQLKVKHAED